MSENYNHSEANKGYRPWVGVFLSFFISGASQFLSGKRRDGVAWFLVLPLLSAGCIWCLASPVVSGDLPAFVVWIITIVLWIVMLVKSYRPVPRFRWFGWIIFILLALSVEEAVFHGLRTFFRPFKIPTASMSPTIQGDRKLPGGTRIGGDHIFVEEYAYWFARPQRGDVVVFTAEGVPEDQRELYRIPPGEFYMKRVVGVPGDVLSIQNGHLYNHGQLLSQPAILAKLDFFNLKFPMQAYLTNPTNDYKVPVGSCFVIGDNTSNSLDSRFYGAVAEGKIIGRVSKIYWPANRAGKIQ